MKRKYLYFGIIVVLIILFLTFFILSNKTSNFETIKKFEGEITIYKSLSCGCCQLYVNYFKKYDNSNINVINIDNSDYRTKYNIPAELTSCHTTIIGNYFVEGHVPLEAIEKLLIEKPDIKGIAMPGMPSGSPGMPGKKIGYFVIYAVNHDGSYYEFMKL